MKKNLIAILIIALVSVGLFATNPGPATFDITTTIGGINLMKITKAAFSGTTETAFTEAAAYTGNDEDGKHHVTAGGDQDITAYISTLSNSRAGYSVKLSATPMTSTIGSQTAYINYTVTVNTTPTAKTFTTDGANTVADVVLFTTGVQSAITPISHKIDLSVNSGNFAAAVEGTYTGTVTFTWTTT